MSFLKWLVHTEFFHGFIIMALFAGMYMSHGLVSKNDMSTKMSFVLFGVAFVGSFFVYRLIINPLFRP